jgi:preprotein translocase subunit SecD
MLNRYPIWKYLVLSAVLIFGIIYSAPNLFGEDPAVQILSGTGLTIKSDLVDKTVKILADNGLALKKIESNENAMLVRFNDSQTQIKAKDALKEALGDGYIVALNLAPVTPWWLDIFGAKPMKLGLDLRGGVHFLMEVDVISAVERRVDGLIGDVRGELRDKKIRQQRITRDLQNEGFFVAFENSATALKANDILSKQYEELDFAVQGTQLSCKLKTTTLQKIKNDTVEQTISTLNNRVNELGVAEAVVQRQGVNHIVVELPGIQDTARAKDILGKTATLEFHMHAKEESQSLTQSSYAPPGTKWYYDADKRPYLLKKRVILTGDSISGATVGMDDRSGRPAVQVRLGGAGLSLFKKVTRENVGNAMGVVYLETHVDNKVVGGELKRTIRTEDRLISFAVIEQALGSRFQITGLNMKEAQDLSLLLRAGALPAAISIVEERTVGPSLGQENIRLGVLSIQVGMVLVLLCMVLYYSLFGLIANLALVFNLVLLIAILSLVGATLTLPGIAGIVLTVGMAVDANVLIFERIREELRTGMSPQAAIHSGFERALSTIIDANVTTLIVGLILFNVGSGPVRGFAVTLCIGILTSMLTAITGTRAMVNLVYGGRTVKKLLVGI